MDDISLKQFLYYQPLDEARPSDKAYLRVANALLHTWRNRRLMQDVVDDLKKVVIICLMGYYQDVVSDAGIFRTFTDEHFRHYGFRVPFHQDVEDYVEYELNLADVEFVLWYSLAFNSMAHRFMHPLDPELLRLARALYDILDREYDSIPDPDDYRSLLDAEMHAEEDRERIHDLSQWLFWRNWLFLPPFQLTFAEIYSGWADLQHSGQPAEKISAQIEQEKHQAMAQLPTGPLALYLREWLSLLLTGKLPAPRPATPEQKREPHPWYQDFIKATGGSDIKFIATYSELNDFLIDGMGWEPGEQHLPQMQGHDGFVLMVTPSRGLLIAKGIASCIKHPLNPLYEKEYARLHAFDLISQRGVCPGDLLRRLLAEDCLPDVRFPERATLRLKTESMPEDTARLNADFLARAYLQEFYRTDN